MLYEQTVKQVIKRDDGAEGEKYISMNKAFVIERKGEGSMDMSRAIAQDNRTLITYTMPTHRT